MKILFVHKSYYPAFRDGGDTMILYDVATELVRLGHDVSVYATNANADEDLPAEYHGDLEIEGVKVHFFARVKSRPARNRYFAPRFAKHLRAHVRDFDLVHLWHIFSYLPFTAGRIAKTAEVPYVISPHANLSPVAFRKNRLMKSLFFTLLERRTFASSSGVQCNTAFDRQWAIDAGIPVAKMLPIVTLGTRDLPGVLEPQRQLRDTYFLFLGRLDRIKGLDFFLRALSILVHQRGVLCKLVLAGPSTSGYDLEFFRLVRELQLQQHVEQVGYAGPRRKVELMKRAACLVLPSYTESFGLVVAEAMSLGTPVIISDQCNIREHVIAADCGFVLPHDVTIWADHLQLALEDRTWGEEVGQRGWEYFRNNLTVTHCVEGLLKNYAAVVNGTNQIHLSDTV